MRTQTLELDGGFLRKQTKKTAVGSVSAQAEDSLALASSTIENRRLPPGNAISVRLLRSREVVLTHVRPILRAHGFTEQQWRVLRALQSSGPLDNSSIARRATLLQPSVSRIVADLRKTGLVEPSPKAKNTRFDRFRLTVQGRARVEPAAKRIEALGSEIVSRMGVADYAELVRLLECLEDRLAGSDLSHL
jgi:homoprotocatechuate degradation regulator HpaR